MPTLSFLPILLVFFELSDHSTSAWNPLNNVKWVEIL